LIAGYLSTACFCRNIGTFFFLNWFGWKKSYCRTFL
jgi:hypothetical protein